MSTFSSTGYTIDRYVDIVDALETDLKAAFGDNIKTDVRSAFGQLIAIFSEATADVNESIEGIVSAYNPQAASGAFLSYLALLNGITRNEAEYSTVTLQCTANAAGCTIPAGSLVSDPAIGEQFATDSALVVAPSSTGNVSATAVNSGPTSAVVGTLTQIDSPIYGWESVTNTVDATEGQDEETDTELRIRRQRAAERTGTANIAAIYTAIADIDSVEQVSVLDHSIDSSVPPLHIWAIVLGGTDNEIAEALFNVVSAGTGYVGDTTVAYSDPITGGTYDITFERPDDISIYIEVDVTADDDYPATGDDDIKDAIVAYFDDFKIGQDVEVSRLYTPINSVEGHYVTSLKVDIITPPAGTSNVSIAANERAVTTLAKITVNS